MKDRRTVTSRGRSDSTPSVVPFGIHIMSLGIAHTHIPQRKKGTKVRLSQSKESQSEGEAAIGIILSRYICARTTDTKLAPTR